MPIEAAELWLPVGINSSYRLALSIPLDDFQRFSLNDLPWFCYVAYTLYGREGHISLRPHGTEIDEGDDIGPNKYYYVLQESALLLDPDMMDDWTSNSTSESTSPGDFRQRVADRDGSCVLTRVRGNLNACHIVPHAKTHQYMVNLSNHRGEGVDSPLDNINDTRNGILLYSAFHRAFGESRVAFLRTPNFAMSVNDVDRVAQPCAALQPLGRERVTFQHFNIIDHENLEMLAPHNCDATIAASDDWPPDLIFDVAYGCAALAKWGTPSFTRKNTREIYYYEEDNDDEANDDDKDSTLVQQTRRAERYARRAWRVDPATVSAEAEEVPDFHDMVLGLWMLSAKKGQRTADSDASKVDAAKADTTRKDVQAWLGSVV